jgi:hypothetical protein
MSFVPPGDVTQACQRLMEVLRRTQLHVVPVGELEGWCRSVGGHGPSWVIAVIEKNLASDPELEGARRFVKAIFS